MQFPMAGGIDTHPYVCELRIHRIHVTSWSGYTSILRHTFRLINVRHRSKKGSEHEDQGFLIHSG